jgi:sugar phosphate isomerase/epimerase
MNPYLSPMKSDHNGTAISRRAFLKTTGVAATAVGVGITLTTATAATAKRKVVVGAHPWVYAATQPNYDLTPVLPQIFADFSYAGMDGIELMHTALNPNDAVARIGELSVKHNLPVIGTSFSGAMWDRGQHALVLENAELVVTRLAKLGGRTLGTSVGALRGAAAKAKKTVEHLDAQAECLKKIIALGTKHGVVVNLHNHTYEVENELHDLKGTLERIPDAKLGPDLNWLVRGGVNPADFIRLYGKQIVFLHLRDQRKDGKWVEAMGEGNMDFHEIATALREVDFSGDAIIELAHEKEFKLTRPLRESVKLSRGFVRRVLGY